MAMGVGVVGLRCNTQGRSGRTTMPIEKACLEAGPERASQSKSLDKNLSHLNEYHFPSGCTTGKELAAWFVMKREEKSQWRRAHGLRGLRSDQAPCSTFVLYPEAKVTRRMRADELQRLIADLLAAWTEWAGHEPDAWVVHWDEVGKDGGMHIHVFDRMLTEDGEYQAAKTMNRDTLARLQREFPETMNRLGDWGVTAHVKGGDPTKIAGLSANDRKKLLAWKRDVEAKAEAAVDKANRHEAELAGREADVKAREDDVDKALDLIRQVREAHDAREESLAGREAKVEAREDAVRAKERELDRRDKQPKTVTVAKDTPETTRRLAALERRVEEQAASIESLTADNTRLTGDVEAKDAEIERLGKRVKGLKAFEDDTNAAFKAAKTALDEAGLVGRYAWGRPTIADIFEKLVTLAKETAERARTAEGKLLALDEAREKRAESREIREAPEDRSDVGGYRSYE